MNLDILYEDDYCIAINKPCGLLVHRTSIAAQADVFALQLLRNQIKQRVYPIHRIDRPTSGVLLFGKSSEAAREIQAVFQAATTSKTYIALARGYTPSSATINRPLTKGENNQKLVEAITHYQTITSIQVPIPVSRYPTARYSLVEVRLETGRWHQIRRHFAKIRHYIIGDKKHGDVKHNKVFKEQLQLTNLFLQATTLQFNHPFLDTKITINAPIRSDFKTLFNKFEWQEAINWIDKC